MAILYGFGARCKFGACKFGMGLQVRLRDRSLFITWGGGGGGGFGVKQGEI